MELTRRLRNLVVELNLPEPDYGLMIGSGLLALLAYPERQLALVAPPVPTSFDEGWALVAADPGDEQQLRTAMLRLAELLGLGQEAQAVGEPTPPMSTTALTLTAEQLAVVRHSAGQAARVLAGAGTGKTRVIVARFGHLVKSGVRPERILALTFSRAAAAQMRTEVLRQLQATSTLWVSTFHSFCLKVIETELAQPLRLLHEAEARAVLAGLAGFTGRKVEEAHAFIGQAKDQLLTPAMVQAYADAHPENQRLAWLADLYTRFQAELTRLEAAEFGDFIVRAVELLETDAALAARWQARFDYILVDEFQDTNLAQFRVLEILARAHGNLMVVGDDDQAIYRFRGATDRFIRQFPALVAGAVSYPVVENFRCPEPVLAVANQLISQNAPEREEKQLYTRTKTAGFPPVACWEARTEREEAEAVAAEIDRRIRTGAKPSDFAILLRSVRRSGGEYERALRERGIAHRLVGETAPHPVITQTQALLRLTRGLNTPDLLTVLAGRVAPAELFAAVRGAAGDLVAYLQGGRGPAPAFQAVCDWIASVSNQPVDGLVYEALCFLGQMQLNLHPTVADLERKAAIRQFQEAAAEAGTLDGLLGLNVEAAPMAADAVTITTVHAAKGLQYKVVFVGALAEGIFPIAVDAAPAFYLAEAIRDGRELAPTERLSQHIREERRLAYVALTRAEQELILTRAQTYGGEAVQPSRFLAEMGAPPAVPVSGRTGDVAGTARAYLVESAAGVRRAEADRVSAAAAVLKAEPDGLPLRRQCDPAPFTPADSLTLSASALGKYRECPRKYYYAYVLHLPEEDNVYTAFGSALHLALERFNLIRLGGEFPAWATVEALWQEAIDPAAFVSTSQHRQLAERGRIFLRRYYDWLAAAGPRQVVSIEGAFEFPYVDGRGRTHRVRGRYDLIERDAAGHEEIIDYKSGVRKEVSMRPRKPENHPQRKLQIGLYYLARHGGRVVPGARVSYIFLRHEKDRPPLTWVEDFDPGDQYITCEHTPQTLQGIRTAIDEIIDRIVANDFTRDPDDFKCSNCPFQDVCEVSRRVYF